MQVLEQLPVKEEIVICVAMNFVNVCHITVKT